MAYTGDNTKAHDTCFKDFFGRREFALDFIKYYIPKEIKDHVDLSTIEVSIAGFVSEEHKEFYSDVVATLYLLNSTQQLVIYFLFEHKSYPDKFAKLQILNYMVQKWLDLKKNHDSIQYLPIIIPVVIYHGTGKWNIGLDFADYFDLPNESFRRYIPKFEHILHDITRMGDEAFKTSIIMEIFHLLFKYIHFPELDQKIQDIYDLLEKLPDEDKRKEYLKIIVKYVLRAGPVPFERVAEHTKRFSGGAEMTGVAFEQIKREVEQELYKNKDKWEREAEKKGKTEGKVERSQEMLISAIQNKFGIIKPSLAAKIRSIQSIETLDSLFNQVFSVKDTKEFSKLVDEVLTDSE